MTQEIVAKWGPIVLVAVLLASAFGYMAAELKVAKQENVFLRKYMTDSMSNIQRQLDDLWKTQLNNKELVISEANVNDIYRTITSCVADFVANSTPNESRDPYVLIELQKRCF
ncbi:MAG: hypothetical protein ACD_40C00331G0011 [uncultured bacterium]|nr:MAG: hypothetical protein ACD_40C00331G0011 [uncultured bacterium]